MKVARVTVTAMIQGLIAGRSVTAEAEGMEAVAVLISVPTPFDAKETERSHPTWYDALSDQPVAQ
jgi:hypothetical protein